MKNDSVVRRKVGKRTLLMRKSHMLPIYMSLHPFYDSALPRIAQKIKEKDGRLMVIDIGANIGDTVSLITEKASGDFLCIEGDKEFIPLLKANTQNLGKSRIYIEECYCSDTHEISTSHIAKGAKGTAKIISKPTTKKREEIVFETIDRIIDRRNKFLQTNLLKIDTDGYEIKILKGAGNFLSRAKPVIHLEFTPSHYIENNQNPLDLFEILRRSGYKEVLIYDNFGVPRSIINTSDTKELKDLIKEIDNKSIYYYDILTYHESKEQKYKDIFQTELLDLTNHINTEYLKTKKYKSRYEEIWQRYLEDKKLLSEERRNSKSVQKRSLQLEESLNSKTNEISLYKRKNLNLLNKILLLKSELKIKISDLNRINSEKLMALEELAKRSHTLQEVSRENVRISDEFNKVVTSHSWKFAMKLSSISRRIAPLNSFRRELLKYAYKILRRYMSLILGLFRKLILEIQIVKFKISKLFRKHETIITNPKANKVLYIGHSFHVKTKSTLFLIKYLKQFFKVRTIKDYSWEGKPFPDLSFIDDSYLAIVFFQNLPPAEIFNNLKIKNKILFPMYDAFVGWRDFKVWKQYKNLKIINFSKYTHKTFRKWGFKSLYIQYFPKPKKFIPGDAQSVYFWQRTGRITIDVVSKILGNQKIKLHIHKAVDPGQQFIVPNPDIERKYQITYSDWYKSKKDSDEVINQSGIYIAPREYEGIGMSFLDAMAVGKAVIASNKPTMSEYIRNKKTGYLFNIDHPKQINLSNVSAIQKNAYTYITKGYERWEMGKHKIIDFIKHD